jgi:hypothetical protein
MRGSNNRRKDCEIVSEIARHAVFGAHLKIPLGAKEKPGSLERW